ncbi:MAG TPA: hypothetical protein VKQ36_02675, partial [Ktedonobacterales bacterium]|nr:hypothetical protein [Ktedonobacterales bacterium]
AESQQDRHTDPAIYLRGAPRFVDETPVDASRQPTMSIPSRAAPTTPLPREARKVWTRPIPPKQQQQQ